MHARGAATALAESPKDDDIVYVGTDDGALWATHDGGDTWFDCFEVEEAAPEGEAPVGEQTQGGPSAAPAPAAARPIQHLVPGPRWVSELVASAHDAKRAYVTLDGHRSDDDAPYALATDDGGKTWRSLTEGLPAGAGSTRTIAEDPVNGDVLYLGTEFQAFVSLDRGANWTRFNGDLPTVAVHAFALNVPSGEVVAGTHGRSLWITSVNELRQMTADVMSKDAHFYKPVSAVIWRSGLGTGDTNRRFAAENPKDGAHFVYHLKKGARAVKLEVLDSAGNSVRSMEAPKGKGLHRVTWNLRGPVNLPADASERQRQWMMRRGGTRVGPGTYTARLTVDGEAMVQKIRVEIDPDHPDPSWITNQEQAELQEFLEEAARDEAEAAAYQGR